MRITTFGTWLIAFGGHLLIAGFILAIVLPGLPRSILSILVVGGPILILAGALVLVASVIRKKTVWTCAICRQDIQRQRFIVWRDPHYKTLHPEYSLWLKRWLIQTYLLMAIFVPLLIVSMFLWLSYGDPYSYFAGFVVLAWITIASYFISWRLLRNLRSFRRAWKDSHKGIQSSQS